MVKSPDDHATLQSIFTKWWRALQRLDSKGNQLRARLTGPVLPPDRKSLAELRRINVIDSGGHSVVDVERALGVAAFRKLIGEIGNAGLRSGTVSRWLNPENSTLEPFAIAAAALARIRKDTGDVKCGATARPLGGDEPIFAEPRFKRLLRARDDDWPDLLAQARRVGAILEREAPVGDLGASLVLWNADPSIRTRWAFNYYQGELESEADSAASPAGSTPSAPPA